MTYSGMDWGNTLADLKKQHTTKPAWPAVVHTGNCKRIRWKLVGTIQSRVNTQSTGELHNIIPPKKDKDNIKLQDQLHHTIEKGQRQHKAPGSITITISLFASLGSSGVWVFQTHKWSLGKSIICVIKT